MRIISIDELLKELDKYKYKEFHIHHTWKPTHKSFNGHNHIQLQRNMRNHHVNTNKWSDIGQHITIMPDGKIVTGRAFNKTPASMTGYNTGAFMVENLGNFDIVGTGGYNSLGYDKLEGKQKETLLKLTKYFIDRLGENKIIFHRERSGKTCPGTGINKRILLDEAKGIKTKPLIKLGDRGSHVKELQSNLTSFGWDVGTIDGIAGNNTIKGIKAFQKAHGLSIDGMFGINSYAILDAAIEKRNDKPKPSGKSEYIKKGNVKIIKTTPDNIEIKVLGDTLKNKGAYGINGALFDLNTAPVTSPESCVMIAMNDGKAISNNSQFNGWKQPPRATMIYQKDKQLGFRKLQDINPIRNIAVWAIGGFMVKPYMDFENENIPSGVNYKTAHSYIGYDDEGYIYLIVKPNHNIPEIVPTLNDLGVVKAIVLDGGGSTQLRHPQGSMQSNRKINTAIVLKEV